VPASFAEASTSLAASCFGALGIRRIERAVLAARRHFRVRGRFHAVRTVLRGTPATACGLNLHLGAETRGAHAVQVLSPEVRLRGERVVRRAPKLQVVRRIRSPQRVSVAMMQLEARGLAAPNAPVVDEYAPRAVTRPHGAPDGARDIAPLGLATARQ
jgi:hypothetical protein